MKGTAKPLQNQAYESIKRRIITSHYRPGDYINETAICTELDLGRTPIHQALKQLMHEGLVQIMPRKGVIVKPLGFNEIQDIIEARALNEGHCAALAAERATSQDITKMRAILKPTKSLIESGDYEALMELDLKFHQAIAEAAGNDVLAEFLVKLHEKALRFWFVALKDIEQLKNVQREHALVFKAIATHDPLAATKAVREHIESFRQTIVSEP